LIGPGVTVTEMVVGSMGLREVAGCVIWGDELLEKHENNPELINFKSMIKTFSSFWDTV
jgi:hypothetical protein